MDRWMDLFIVHLSGNVSLALWYITIQSSHKNHTYTLKTMQIDTSDNCAAENSISILYMNTFIIIFIITNDTFERIPFVCLPNINSLSLCHQLGLPLSSLCTVPCNTIFGSQHQMVGEHRWNRHNRAVGWSERGCGSCPVCPWQDVALLDKLIKEDVEAGKLPLLLIANAGEGH